MHIVKSTVYAVNCIDLRVVNIDLRVVNRWNKLDQQMVKLKDVNNANITLSCCC